MTPRRLDALLRAACAAATGLDADGLPAADPRRVPPERPGDYATALPMRLAGPLGRPARDVAADLAAELRTRPHVTAAVVDGPGFVNVSLTAVSRVSLLAAAAEDGMAYLAGAPLAEMTTGPAAAAWAASALDRAETVAAARDWARADARRRIALAAAGVSAAPRPGASPCPARRDPAAPVAAVGEGGWRDPLFGAVDVATEAARLLAVTGEASARVAFCRSLPERPRPGEETGPGLPALPTADAPGLWARHGGGNPAFAVRYAHAHARTTLEVWAPALGLPPAGHPFPAGPDVVADLSAPPAAALVGALFDGPGTLATAARRSEPHILVRYLEGLAAAYHEWRESCDVVLGESGGATASDDARGEVTAARLGACAAVAGVLRAGLSLIGVAAPTRL
ncbi:arginyl-tRNA synthetase [Marinactinospora thermotolerans DSM 45154]|uniref:arginine--tRNA ligase n=1 Tax=Marinactinospora thermotolerans DSM 45154 TaxID=1122192 RepID=A0A1T4QAD5_9ACTN|nr:DALR anticodon-binding domain-containing protein [Marinactinospora thermotolerans]SKA00644.1 arginyl-tRNA synthetase [Marinactinospora thermotolerans DSM 45154]